MKILLPDLSMITWCYWKQYVISIYWSIYGCDLFESQVRWFIPTHTLSPHLCVNLKMWFSIILYVSFILLQTSASLSNSSCLQKLSDCCISYMKTLFEPVLWLKRNLKNGCILGLHLLLQGFTYCMFPFEVSYFLPQFKNYKNTNGLTDYIFT